MTYRSFLSLILAVATHLAATAQDSANGSPAPEPEADSVTRVNDPACAVSFVMPRPLLERVLDKAGAEKTETGSDTETEAEDTEAEKPRTKSAKSAGYRVQVYADNNARTAKANARQRERAISGAFPSYATYVTYASPYWRLRVGDFRSQYDAEKAAAEIKRAFPSYAREVRVVRDRVNHR